MRSVRSVLCHMLDYTIERFDEYDDAGLAASIRFETRCPHTGEIVASSPTLYAAKQCVIGRELQASNAERWGAPPDDRYAA